MILKQIHRGPSPVSLFVALCLFFASANVSRGAETEESWEDWLSGHIGSVKAERADEIAGMLAELENEHSVVLAKREECALPDIAVGTDSGITQFARAVGEKMGCTIDTLEVSYGHTSYTYETLGNVADGSLKVKLNDDLKTKANVAKTKIIEIMADQTINRNMVGREKPPDWHRRLNDVQAVCLGFGSELLSAVRATRTTKDGSVNFAYQAPTVMDAVEIAWTMCAVAKVRKLDLPSPKLSDIAAKVAFERGSQSLLANERRMKIILKVSLAALEDGVSATMPASLPAWNAVSDEPVPVVEEKRAKLLDYWTPVPTDEELSNAQSKVSERLRDLRGQFKKLLVAKRYDEATRLFDELCLSDGADFALAAAGASTKGGQQPLAAGKKGSLDKMRWLMRLSEVTEARNYLRANEDVLSCSKANFYHHYEAAQRFVILGDNKRFLDEMFKVDRQSERIISTMREGKNAILSSEYASYGRKLQGRPHEPEFTIAEYWWRQAKGKRKRVMDCFLSLSAKWYDEVVKKSYVYGEKKPEWYRIAQIRARWKPAVGELKVSLDTEKKAVGASGVMMPVLDDAVESPKSILSARTVTWTNRKKEKTREEVFYRPRDYWEHKAHIVGWMDEKGNEMRVFKVQNLPLRDDEFDEEKETCPTKEHLEERLTASSSTFTDDKASLALWASRFYGVEADERSLTKVPCGKMAKAYVFATGELSSGGLFLNTYRKEWLFVAMQLAGEVADIGALLRRVAIGAKTVSWNDTVGAPVGREDGMLVYTAPGYVIKVDMSQSLATRFMSRIKPMLVGSRTAFMTYVPTDLTMKPSVLHVFNDRKKYDAYVTKATEHLENRTIGMWIGSREELLVMSGMKKVDDPVGEETFRTLRHEAFHQYLFYATGRKVNAMWFNEGHAAFFETAVYSSGNNPLLPVDDQTLRWPKPFYKDVEKMARLMPEILTLSNSEFYDGPLETVNNRYAAAWGLIYFLEKGIKVMDGLSRYENVLPTYLAEMMKDGGNWKEASMKAWKTVNTKALPLDFMRFWNNPAARKAARAYRPR